MIELKPPTADLNYQFDWSDAIPAAAVAILNVAHQVPAPLVLVSQSFDSDARTSNVEIFGGVHRGLYVVKALATLSTGETVPGQFTLRVADS